MTAAEFLVRDLSDRILTLEQLGYQVELDEAKRWDGNTWSDWAAVVEAKTGGSDPGDLPDDEQTAEDYFAAEGDAFDDGA